MSSADKRPSSMDPKAASAAAGAKPASEHETPGAAALLYPPSGGAHASALAESSAAFARGDFRQARRLAGQVLEGDPLPEERAFAQEICRRTSWDPVALGVGLASLLILILTLILTLNLTR